MVKLVQNKRKTTNPLSEYARNYTYEKFRRLFGDNPNIEDIEFAILLNLNLADHFRPGRTSNKEDDTSNSYRALAAYYLELAQFYGYKLRRLSVYEKIVQRKQTG